ncbi:MAG: hypothetical protein JW862_13440 [Anaerolineales bacterium]|nr:hypothetical protein [Anaerolineales bacterium]
MNWNGEPAMMAESHSNDVENIDLLLDQIRAILLTQDRSRLRELEASLQALQARADRLSQELQPAIVAEKLKPEMSNLIRRTIQDSHAEMAEAIGPVMGEAIRVQIREARGEMVEALYPVIGGTVQRAIAEFAREFQRNIDARLRSTIGPRGYLRRLLARLRGVSDAELALRDALPFRIREVFLIQHGSGLLLAHSHTEGGQGADSDLVSAMLTAIRDFVRTSFSAPDQLEADLDEIDYGDLHILVQSGKHAYLALVYAGVEPEGFRAEVRAFVSELHVRFGAALRDYDGDPAMLPSLAPQMEELVASAASQTETRRMSPGQRAFLWGSLVAIVAFLAVSCFYLRFTIALWPLAFPGPSATASQTATETLTPTITASLTATPEPTKTATVTPSPSPSRTPTSTATSQPTATEIVISAVTIGSVWVLEAPDIDAPRLLALEPGVRLQVLAVQGNWALVSWQIDQGGVQGWVSLPWLATDQEIPAAIVTPVQPAP